MRWDCRQTARNLGSLRWQPTAWGPACSGKGCRCGVLHTITELVGEVEHTWQALSAASSGLCSGCDLRVLCQCAAAAITRM